MPVRAADARTALGIEIGTTHTAEPQALLPQVATSDTDYTKDQFDKVFKALGDYTRQVFTTVRKVSPS